MISLIVGNKGSGKTKKLIQLANEAVDTSTGNVVVIEKGAKLTYDINHKARLIDTNQYGIQGFDAFYGFISGICAGNYDVNEILIDSTLKIGGQDLNELAGFITKINDLASKTDTKFIVSVSVDEEALPESIRAVAVEL